MSNFTLIFLLISTSFYTLVSSSCGVSHSNSNVGPRYFGFNGRFRRSPVVGGFDTPPTNHPWMASITIKPTGISRCGGVIIGSNVILTAAHCVQLSASSYGILVGSTFRGHGNHYSVKKIVTAVGYAGNSYHDIALVFTNEAITFNNYVQPACVPTTNDLFEGHYGTILGFGSREFSGPPSMSLQEAKVPILKNSLCNRTYKSMFSHRQANGITDDMMCAGYALGGVDSCQVS